MKREGRGREGEGTRVSFFKLLQGRGNVDVDVEYDVLALDVVAGGRVLHRGQVHALPVCFQSPLPFCPWSKGRGGGGLLTEMRMKGST